MIGSQASKEIEKEHHHKEKEGEGVADEQVGEARERLNLLRLGPMKSFQNGGKVNEDTKCSSKFSPY